MTSIRIITWNINGLSPNTQELDTMLKVNKIDIALISETHLNDQKTVTFNDYSVYSTNHPDGTSHGGTAVVIKNNLKHHLHSEFKEEYLQATTVTVDGKMGPINISAVYCPPKHKIKEDMLNRYFSTLGHKYICGGDWNCKHTYWGSRLTTTRGREMKKCIDHLSQTCLSTGEPTYWPTDPQKIPDLLDFFVIKGLSEIYFDVKSSPDSISDHDAVIATFSETLIQREQKLTLYNHKTDWNAFSEYLEEVLNLKISLKTEDDIEEATFYITNTIQEAAWRSTPCIQSSNTPNNVPLEIRVKLAEKRRLRRRWQLSRLHLDKVNYNRASRELTDLIRENENNTFEHKISSLSPLSKDNYSLWKITKNFKRPQQSIPPIRMGQEPWARRAKEKAELFAKHLSQVFTPNESTMPEFEQEVDIVVNSDQQLSLPLKLVTPKELYKKIKNLENKKAPGFDLITGEVLKHLPRKAVVFLTMLFNAIMRVQHFPMLWKVSQICMIAKPGKPPTEPSSYRPISLLPVISKVFEKILLDRLRPVLQEHKIIPDHQFGFREGHSTVEQVHRVVHKIRQSLENKQYCSAAFLDVQQAFDRVWHKGLCYKLKTLLPNSFYMILKSYLEGRKFQVKYDEEISELYEIKASVPQGSVLGPVLYTIFTADLPRTEEVETATYADDTACLASDVDPAKASQKLQKQLNKTDYWLQKWRIKSSATKSTHITFTLRKGECTPVSLGNETLPKSDCVKYLGMHLDKRLTWAKHIKTKRNASNFSFQNLSWLIGRKSPLSLHNKLLVYKVIIKPIWTYGIELWGTASNSNVEILQRFQNKALRTISSASWFTRNSEIHEHLEMETVKEALNAASIRYKNRLQKHVNELAKNLLDTEGNIHRLKRWQIEDLDNRT